jgi:hypothetical protein
MFGLVREHRRASDIANRVNARTVRFVEFVDDNDAAIGFHADFLKAEIFSVADNADGGDDALNGQRL